MPHKSCSLPFSLPTLGLIISATSLLQCHCFCGGLTTARRIWCSYSSSEGPHRNDRDIAYSARKYKSGESDHDMIQVKVVTLTFSAPLLSPNDAETGHIALQLPWLIQSHKTAPPQKNKVSPRTQKQKEACNPGKIHKHTLAGQNEASAPSRLRGNHDISSIAPLVRTCPPLSAIYTPVHALVSFESPPR